MLPQQQQLVDTLSRNCSQHRNLEMSQRVRRIKVTQTVQSLKYLRRVSGQRQFHISFGSPSTNRTSVWPHTLTVAIGLASISMLASVHHLPTRMDGPSHPQSTTPEPNPATQEKCLEFISWWLRREDEKAMTAVAMANTWLVEFHRRNRLGHIASKQELLIALASTRVVQLGTHEKNFERIFGSNQGSAYQEMMKEFAQRENACLADCTLGYGQDITFMSSAAKTAFIGMHLTQLTKDLSQEVFDLTPTTREEKFDRREFLELLRKSEFMALPPVEKIIISYALQHAVKVDNVLSNNSDKRRKIETELSKVGVSATTQKSLDLWKAGRLVTIWHRSEVRREFLMHQKDQHYRWI
ncbi:hypothetical protein EG327_004702 [Venturia inaequalis]|uniref:Uncharacterized protein n=1 Tax=Venturia inaequalis TaxID=5025 RepID=A0A8H3VAK5_VENIN|nr:hypothetical protein EG327_004702 [Venturia inaequalis]